MSEFKKVETAWCPGCGNFSIVDCMTQALKNLNKNPKDVLLVGGIGQAAKTNQYIVTNGFSGLHGRSLPAAVAAKMTNQNLTVIVNSGDGDSYGEGGNHFIHNIRRNVNITQFVHNNQIYGLTKGQVSPTTEEYEDFNELNGFGNLNTQFNPMTIAIATGATFVARGFSGNPQHLISLMEKAILHKGHSVVDILQPCITFNKKNTFAYYKNKCYELDESYDSSNKFLAYEKAEEFEERIPIGIIYLEERESFEQRHPVLSKGNTLLQKDVDFNRLKNSILELK